MSTWWNSVIPENTKISKNLDTSLLLQILTFFSHSRVCLLWYWWKQLFRDKNSLYIGKSNIYYLANHSSIPSYCRYGMLQIESRRNLLSEEFIYRSSFSNAQHVLYIAPGASADVCNFLGKNWQVFITTEAEHARKTACLLLWRSHTSTVQATEVHAKILFSYVYLLLHSQRQHAATAKAKLKTT